MMSKLLLSALLVACGCCGRPATTPEAATGAASPPEARDETAALATPPGELEDAAAASEPAAGRPDAEAVRAAIARALPFVESEGIAWMEGRVSVQDGAACVSCHHVGYAVWSHAAARRAEAGGGGAAIAELERTAEEFLSQPSVPRALSAGSFLIADVGPAPQLVAALIELQTESGGWEAKGQFPTQRRPMAESNAVATMVALIVLDRAAATAADSDRPALERARRRGAAWLADTEAGASAEWLALRLVLAAAGEPERVDELRVELSGRQRDDGGWGWQAGDESDAFSTGQAVWALAATGGEADAVARGVDFLLAAQSEDGSWWVPSSAISREPTADKDVIYHFWGSAWAVVGLARSLAPANA